MKTETTTTNATLDRLEADLGSIKDTANESSCANPPDGYEELEGEPARIADACYHAGFDAMETALKNWIYDQRNNPAKPMPDALAVLRAALPFLEEHAESERSFWGDDDRNGLAEEAEGLLENAKRALMAQRT